MQTEEQNQPCVLDPNNSAVDWETWLNAPGMPPVANEFDGSLAAAAAALKNRWVSNSGEGCTAADLEGWHTGQVNLVWVCGYVGVGVGVVGQQGGKGSFSYDIRTIITHVTLPRSLTCHTLLARVAHPLARSPTH
jgi:hypothetical protein